MHCFIGHDAAEDVEEVSKYLINAGADINLTDQDGDSALIYATTAGYYKMWPMFLPKITNNNAKRYLMYLGV